MSDYEIHGDRDDEHIEYCAECHGSGFRYYTDGGRDLCEGCGGTGRYS